MRGERSVAKDAEKSDHADRKRSQYERARPCRIRLIRGAWGRVALLPSQYSWGLRGFFETLRHPQL